MATVSKVKTHVGVGLYSLAEAARVTGVHPARIRRWVSDEGLVPRFLKASARTMTFVELMEVMFIKMFRDEGVSLATIRKASEVAARRFRTSYPFSVKRFDTDGRTIFATLLKESADRATVEDLQHGQYVFEQIVKPFFRKLDYRGAMEVVRYWPLDKDGRIVLDPLRKFGKPIDAETGVATRVIYDAVRAGRGQDNATVAEWLGIPVAAVEAAVSFERSINA